MLRRLLLVSFITPILTGCQCLEYLGLHKPTYRTVRVCDDTCPFPGVPTAVQKMHQLTITWEKKDAEGAVTSTTTRHLVKLPVMYGVDIHQSCTGTTTSKFTMDGDGALTEASGTIDHKIPEILTAVGDILDSAAVGGSRAISEINAFPPLPTDAGNPVDIQIVEIGN